MTPSQSRIHMLYSN